MKVCPDIRHYACFGAFPKPLIWIVGQHTPLAEMVSYEDGTLTGFMLEQPDLQDEYISACVQDAYGVRVVHVAFLPLDAVRHTAVYRVVADSVDQ